MSYSFELEINNILTEVNAIQININHINEITDQAVSCLEGRKRRLKGPTDPDDATVQENIDDLLSRRDKIVEELTTTVSYLKLRNVSMDRLDYTITTLEREIARLENERADIILELEEKKLALKERLRAIKNIDLLVNELTNKIDKTMLEFGVEMNEMMQERKKLVLKSDQVDTAAALEELEKDMEGKKEEFGERIANLEQQINLQLKEQSLQLSPSGRFLTSSGRIINLQDSLAAGLLEGANIHHLLAKEKLKKNGLELTHSGRICTLSGTVLSIEDAAARGLLEGINMEDLLSDTSTTPDVSMKSSSTQVTSESIMSSADVQYLKKVIGKPVTLALAEICTKQPRNPIYYLGHWLFKYRYNQEVDETKKKEIEELVRERDRLREEKLREEIEQTARNAVLEMVFKAYDEALAAELQRIALNQQIYDEENEEHADEENADEDRDVLGEYNGPPIRQY